MLSTTLRTAIEDAVRDAAGTRFAVDGVRSVGGGCIHRAYALEGRGKRYFAKVNDASHGDNFAAEADGLAALAAAGLRVPAPIAHGVAAGDAFLVLEHLELGGGSRSSARELGRGLARLHAADAGRAFGWHRPNYIGSTPQPNRWHDDWPTFWAKERIAPQLALARANGLGARLSALGEKLLERIPGLLTGHAPKPALVHGDLWSGNTGTLVSGAPVVFDPAVYVGDAEVDLAMTELFGGFATDFYAGYAEVAPPSAGYAERRALYNLYHVLNHANLFGGGYVDQAEHMIARLLDR